MLIPSHVGIEVKKAQRRGCDYTTRKKTNLIQEEYPTSIPHTYWWNGTDAFGTFLVLG